MLARSSNTHTYTHTSAKRARYTIYLGHSTSIHPGSSLLSAPLPWDCTDLMMA